MDVQWPAEDELAERLQVIRLAAKHLVGVNVYEHALVDLLQLLQSDRLPHSTAVDALLKLVRDWDWGAVELLEFSMRSLQWPEVREALAAHAAHGDDPRTRDLAQQVLQVFEPEWPDGEIYRTYRPQS
ncbi:hypothetical protein GCM10009623_36590 [Nocardioides aestuarii]|uniref:HEAT repeat domain-containing protein n=1 Tax=Nocardioides aestuarii TaxID=252231 RepID=A0ABW4TQL4_9ACTN